MTPISSKGSESPSGALTLENPFWSFALRLYARPEVAPTCLGLQDGFGVNVSLLLFGIWSGAQGRRLEGAGDEALDALVAAWNDEVVVNLRRARRAWKTFCAADPALLAGREDLKAVELLSEQILCAILYRAHAARAGAAAGGGGPDRGAMAANVARMLARAGVNEAARAPLLALLVEAGLAAA